MISRLLVANRGEIARRVMRTAAGMGIESVAVYADGDVDAPFVADADHAVALGGSTATDTYLDIAKILDAARTTGADAVHPGYGFLSENADFARAVVGAGLVWVGPPPDAIAAMGDKLAAKELMVRAGVPTLPSARIGADEKPDADVGFPLLVKASAGGGGKGMRVVHRAADLEEAVAAARREALAAFGDGTVFLERYVTGARHVEIQILGDAHGNVVHCFERECSIQRRHQKIIEEAPSPAVDEKLRARMGGDAVAAAVAIGYQNAGTVEFLLDADGSYYFLEVNTRLQVEHPVTEAVTGLDLVREQLLVAAGEPLRFGQDDLHLDGHAIEARVYAEDPAAGFLPATGRLVAWAPPATPVVRVESGVASGSVV
ncbi:MAG: acetyl-CoA carboxylase biotin carboxylase subunit, partial [Actinoallomurus sp.]